MVDHFPGTQRAPSTVKRQTGREVCLLVQKVCVWLICVSSCLCVSKHSQVSIYMQTSAPHLMLPSVSPHLMSCHGFLTKPEAHLDRLVGSKFEGYIGIYCFYCPLSTAAFTWCWGSEHKSSCLHSRYFPLNHLLSPIWKVVL